MWWRFEQTVIRTQIQFLRLEKWQCFLARCARTEPAWMESTEAWGRMAPIRHPDRLLAAWANDLQRPGETRRNTERGAMSLTRWHDAAQIRLGDGSRERKRPVAHAQMQLPALIFPNSHHHNRWSVLSTRSPLNHSTFVRKYKNLHSNEIYFTMNLDIAIYILRCVYLVFIFWYEKMSSSTIVLSDKLKILKNNQ